MFNTPPKYSDLLELINNALTLKPFKPSYNSTLTPCPTSHPLPKTQANPLDPDQTID